MIIGKYKWMVDQLAKDEMHQSPQGMMNHILEKRGILTTRDKQLFLTPSIKNMHDPMDLLDMEKAVERIEKAKTNNEKITIYGDYDVDGITSTSILYMFLKENGYDIDYYIPDRISEGYGFNKEALEAIRGRGTSLMISVDTGISATEEVNFANEIGLDIIITDHHECQAILPNAHAVINPKRPNSNYPFKELAGVGVAFKLIHALAVSLNKVDSIWKYIDLVAIGTVADIVPLVDENRIIVKNAFDTIPTTWNVGLKALLEVSGSLDKKISSGTIGFQIGPRLNVAGRLGDAKKGVQLFTTTDKELALAMAKELDAENKKRQQIEREIFNLAIEKIEKTIDINKQKVIVVAGKGWHNGVVGIVSSRITERYYKPSIVISIDEDGMATGSGRSISGFSMFDALCDARDYLVKFGGHDMAAGLSLEEENIEAFTKHINDYAQVVIDEEMLKAKITIDCDIGEDHINIPMIEELEQLEPYGIGNPTPVFRYQGQVYSAEGIGADEKHLRLKLYTAKELINGIGFNMGYQSKVMAQGEKVELVGNLQKNEWRGVTTPQLVIKDIKSPYNDMIKSQYYLRLYKELPNPTLEKFKVFTSHIETCYISSYRINDIEKEYIKQLSYMVPSREDVAAVYRYLRNQRLSNIDQVSLHALIRDVKIDFMSEYKVLQILHIFKELGLLSYEYDVDKGIITFQIVADKKNDLTNSKRYQYLNEIK